MVKSEKIYSPQSYICAVTGWCYTIRGENDIKFIEDAIDIDGLELCHYSLNEIDIIVKDNIDVVLVDCMVVNEKTDEFEHQYVWFEVTEDFKEEEE